MAVIIGIGLQTYCLTFLFVGTMTVAMTNVFFRPFLFALAFIYSAGTAWFNGFFTAKAMKFFGATDWCFAACASAMILPLYMFSILIAVDVIEYFKRSSSGMPPFLVVCLAMAWMCLSVPLAFNGAYTGFKQEKVKSSIRSNPLKRRIPEQPWYLD